MFQANLYNRKGGFEIHIVHKHLAQLPPVVIFPCGSQYLREAEKHQGITLHGAVALAARKGDIADIARFEKAVHALTLGVGPFHHCGIFPKIVRHLQKVGSLALQFLVSRRAVFRSKWDEMVRRTEAIHKHSRKCTVLGIRYHFPEHPRRAAHHKAQLRTINRLRAAAYGVAAYELVLEHLVQRVVIHPVVRIIELVDGFHLCFEKQGAIGRVHRKHVVELCGSNITGKAEFFLIDLHRLFGCEFLLAAGVLEELFAIGGTELLIVVLLLLVTAHLLARFVGDFLVIKRNELVERCYRTFSASGLADYRDIQIRINFPAAEHAFDKGHRRPAYCQNRE